MLPRSSFGKGRFITDRRGSVTVIAAVALPILIGVAALVAEFGYGLLNRIDNQRVADLAAYSGALAYNSTSSTSSMDSAVANIAALNGLPSSAVTGTLIASPNGNGRQAVSVSVSTSRVLLLAPVLRVGNQMPVAAAAAVEFAPQASSCITALSGTGTGVTLSGGTSISAPNCGVASNTSVTVPCGTTVTTKAVSYNSSSAPSQPCGGIGPPSGTASTKITKTSTADPLSGNAGVSSATSRISTVAALTSPAAPAVTAGTDIDFAYNVVSTQAQATTAGCTATKSGGTWTLTCPAGATRNFGNITLGGGITVNFNTGGTSANTYNFSGSITNSGTSLQFGPGTYNVKQGITTGGGSTTSFGAGTFKVGPGASACSGSGAAYSICNTGTSLTFGGPSTFVLSNGIYNSGGSTLTLGSGTTNSYQIGSSSAGNALWMGGSAITSLADATTFSVVGNLNVASGGGSCLTLPAAAQHDINGDMSTAGGTILGAGVYTVNGYVALGANGGGDVTCAGATVGLSGAGVTFVISGVRTPSSGTCSGQAFCVAAGYGHVSLTAPTSGTTANLVVVGPTVSSRTAGASFAEGASTSLSGLFYFPYGPLTLSGGASVGNGTGQCLQLIGSQITLTGGTTAGSLCVSGTTTSGTVVLVQ